MSKAEENREMKVIRPFSFDIFNTTTKRHDPRYKGVVAAYVSTGELNKADPESMICIEPQNITLDTRDQKGRLEKIPWGFGVGIPVNGGVKWIELGRIYEVKASQILDPSILDG
ncbi:hypothetical protein A2Z22_00475 [Candidatus Woesebacteria bacterium RBG_16_34_12]|uniref:Uncharacterized protein n=1 Tax=Candidatus Woesebacteria bacterium RBG_16_34_12 TaxID=1802480 RepID=A0A1F7X8Z1_9BACT|nr:MAG: hypothetical protein A2Z22_00475 [Candidatus Woesebacteria bacterium RBG_16_34_12]